MVHWEYPQAICGKDAADDWYEHPATVGWN